MRASTEWLFRVGLFVKGVDSVFEVVGGVLLAVPTKVARYVGVITQHDVFRHHAVLAGKLNTLAETITTHSSIGEAIYLGVHGLAKVILILAILFGRRWGYVGLIAVLGFFAAIEFIRAMTAHEIVTGVLGVFDLAVVILIQKEYRSRFPTLAEKTGQLQSEAQTPS